VRADAIVFDFLYSNLILFEMSDTTIQIIPMLAYEDGIAAMDWLCKAFGFLENQDAG